MSKKWDYAMMAHEAKKFGGPEKYVSIIKDHSFQDGRKYQLIIDGAIFLGVGALYLGNKAYLHFKNKKISEELAEAAEQVLIKNMTTVLEEEKAKEEQEGSDK